MTIFPEHPHIEKAEPKNGKEMRRLVEDHVTFVKFYLGWSLMVIVKAGYITDGASVPFSIDFKDESEIDERIVKLVRKYFPGENCKDVIRRLIGTPWDMPRLLAAVVHDALYSIKWCIRYLCDQVYKRILANTDYARLRRETEYDVIRLVGWRNWKTVSKEEIAWAKPLVLVAWVRDKKIDTIVEKLRGDEN